eukprot:144586-Hanusia_phi.AAC.1
MDLSPSPPAPSARTPSSPACKLPMASTTRPTALRARGTPSVSSTYLAPRVPASSVQVLPTSSQQAGSPR